MPRKPSQELIDAAKKALDPTKVVEAVINDMHDDELEQRLIDAGIAIKAGAND